MISLLKNRFRGIKSRAVLIQEGKILLLQKINKSGQSFYTIPGGTNQIGESLEETCLREMEEECSLHVMVGQLLFAVDSGTSIGYYFECFKQDNEEKIIISKSELVNTKYEWVPLVELKNFNLFPKELHEYINNCVNNKDFKYYTKNRINNRKILIISSFSRETPPLQYGGIQRMAALAYEAYKSIGYEVDIVSSLSSRYHTFDPDQLFSMDLTKYKYVISYNDDEEILNYIDNTDFKAIAFLGNNCKPSKKYLQQISNVDLYVLSESQRQQYIQELNLPLDIIPNGVDSRKYVIHQQPNRNNDICFIGAIGQHKSPLACLQYAKKYSLGIDFYGPLIFNEAEKEYGEKFLSEVKQYPQARLLGEISENDKPLTLSTYNYFIFLPGVDKDSWIEPFGLAPLEAMLCGCTVITTYKQGGHLSYCNDSNSIDFNFAPKRLDTKSIRESVLGYDFKTIFSRFYPR